MHVHTVPQSGDPVCLCKTRTGFDFTMIVRRCGGAIRLVYYCSHCRTASTRNLLKLEASAFSVGKHMTDGGSPGIWRRTRTSSSSQASTVHMTFFAVFFFHGPTSSPNRWPQELEQCLSFGDKQSPLFHTDRLIAFPGLLPGATKDRQHEDELRTAKTGTTCCCIVYPIANCIRESSSVRHRFT